MGSYAGVSTTLCSQCLRCFPLFPYMFLILWQSGGFRRGAAVLLFLFKPTSFIYCHPSSLPWFKFTSFRSGKRLRCRAMNVQQMIVFYQCLPRKQSSRAESEKTSRHVVKTHLHALKKTSFCHKMFSSFSISCEAVWSKPLWTRSDVWGRSWRISVCLPPWLVGQDMSVRSVGVGLYHP